MDFNEFNNYGNLRSRRFEQFPGMFMTVEGPDGSGKTTVMPVIINSLKELGIDPVVVRQPGGSPFAEKVRQLVLGTEDTGEPVQPISEALLFAAARAQCLESVVKPAMRAGRVVVADRWYDSNYAYQGVGRGMLKEVEMLEEMVEGSFSPNLTIFLNLPLSVAQARLAGRVKEFNRMNAEEMQFKQRTYEGYQRRRAYFSGRMVEIDVDRSPEEVAGVVKKYIQHCFVPAFVARKQSHETHAKLFEKVA